MTRRLASGCEDNSSCDHVGPRLWQLRGSYVCNEGEINQDPASFMKPFRIRPKPICPTALFAHFRVPINDQSDGFAASLFGFGNDQESLAVGRNVVAVGEHPH